jgi:hypothetical protein
MPITLLGKSNKGIGIMLTKSVLCGMMLWISSGCASTNYKVGMSLGVDNHVNFEKPVMTAKLTIESK